MTDPARDPARGQRRRAALVVQVAEVRDLLEIETRWARRESWIKIPIMSVMSLFFWSVVLLGPDPSATFALVMAMACTVTLVVVARRLRQRFARIDDLREQLDRLEESVQGGVPDPPSPARHP